MRRQRKQPFKSTLPPSVRQRIELVCNDWCDGMTSEERLDIIQLLRSLPIKQRVPMVLKAQGYSFAEIAQRTGRKKSAVHGSFRLAEQSIRRGMYRWVFE